MYFNIIYSKGINTLKYLIIAKKISLRKILEKAKKVKKQNCLESKLGIILFLENIHDAPVVRDHIYWQDSENSSTI